MSLNSDPYYGLGERTIRYLQTEEGRRVQAMPSKPWDPSFGGILADAYGNYGERFASGASIVAEQAAAGVGSVTRTIGEGIGNIIPRQLWIILGIAAVAAVAIYALNSSGGVAALKGKA